MRARRPLALAATGLALALTLASCGGSGDHTGMSADMSGTTAVTGDGRAADISFAQLMIPHHQQAIEMADLALDRETSAEVASLATQIKAAQDPEIDQMRAWLAAWGAPEQMPGATSSDGGMDHSGMDMGGMSEAGMMSAEDMQNLMEASGDDFERMWLQMMIAHHEGAVAMANQVLAATADDEVRSLAEAVVSGQTEEISAMRALLGGATTATASPAAAVDVSGAGWAHVHNLAFDGDGVLLLGTHKGLYRQVPGERPELLSETRFDVMGLAHDGDRWLASGHPGEGEDLPADLGLRASPDGRAWTSVSLLGEVDFHRLTASGSTVMGVSAHDQALLRSTDAGRTWTQLENPGVFDLAVHPQRPQGALATTPSGPMSTTDGGDTWRPITGAPVVAFVGWAGDELRGVAPDGTVYAAAEPGGTWREIGSAGGEPAALAVDGQRVAVLVGSTVRESIDGGRTFTDRITGIDGH